MEIGIKERRKYRDIAWLMPSVDVESVLEKLDCKVAYVAGNEVRTYCPDHHLFVGREPSDPHCTINKETGETFCFTEGRGSNLLWVVCRLLECPPKEAIRFLTGLEADISIETLNIARRNHSRRRMVPSRYRDPEREDEGPQVKGLAGILRDLNNRHMSERAYRFFISPPGKQPTNIQAETVDRYKIFERTWGMYADRAVVPFYLRRELVGFCAIDLLGIKEWLVRNPLKGADDYRKTLYPFGFQSGEYLFGFDDCKKGCACLIVVEGPREVMKLWQEGFPNTVAIMGSYMSDKHHELITEIAPKSVSLMFDGDEAGRVTTERVALKLSRLFGGRTRKCTIPEGKDPKNLGREDFWRLLRD